MADGSFPFEWEYRVLEYGICDPAFPEDFDYPDDDVDVHQTYECAWESMLSRKFQISSFDGIVSPEEFDAPQPFIMRQRVDLSPLKRTSNPQQITNALSEILARAETQFLFETATDAEEFKLIWVGEQD